MTDPLLELRDLNIRYRTSDEDIRAVTNASLSIDQNEYFGLLGESGCGKSTLAQSLFGGLDENATITSGKIIYDGREIQDFTEREFNEHIRWNEISVIPQAAMNSLDPLLKISHQAVELAHEREGWSEDRTLDRLRELFDVVGIPESRIHDYPHQFSGGMKQRTVIAMALLLEPSLIVADEPTTALDVIMQDQILEYLSEVQQDRDVSLLMITHDISVIFENCDSAAVMHGGQIAESGSVRDILNEPRHPYTILLQEAFPDIRYPDRELEVIEGTPPALRQDVDYCTFADRCPWAIAECHNGDPPLESVSENGSHLASCIRHDEMEELASEFLNDESTTEQRSAPSTPPSTARGTAFDDRREAMSGNQSPVMELRGVNKYFSPSANILESAKNWIVGNETTPVRAVDGIDLSLEENQVQGLIGESGCGKTTLLMTLVGRYQPTEGEIYYQGNPVAEFDKSDWSDFRRRVQLIFQDPFNSMNPKFTVRDALREPLQIHGIEKSEEAYYEVLERVRLRPAESYIDRRAPQLSGGEKQRVSIARALIMDPDIILADEPVSMLDVSTQAAILNLLDDLTSELDVSMFYISHDLSTVSYICDRVNVMYLGRIVESAPTEEILFNPKHPYTQALINAIPVPDPDHRKAVSRISGAPGDASNLPSGCRFKDRCPERMDVCDETPAYFDLDGDAGHHVACHLYDEHVSSTDQVIQEDGVQL